MQISTESICGKKCCHRNDLAALRKKQPALAYTLLALKIHNAARSSSFQKPKEDKGMQKHEALHCSMNLWKPLIVKHTANRH